MSDDQQDTIEDDVKKAKGKAFIKKLIITKVILLIIMAGVGYYLFLTI